MHFKKEILLLLSSGNGKCSTCQRNSSHCTDDNCTNTQVSGLCRSRSTGWSGTAAALTAVIRTALTAGIISTIDIDRCGCNGTAGYGRGCDSRVKGLQASQLECQLQLISNGYILC